MARNTLETLKHLLQDLEKVSDNFETIFIGRLKVSKYRTW